MWQRSRKYDDIANFSKNNNETREDIIKLITFEDSDENQASEDYNNPDQLRSIHDNQLFFWIKLPFI